MKNQPSAWLTPDVTTRVAQILSGFVSTVRTITATQSQFAARWNALWRWRRLRTPTMKPSPLLYTFTEQWYDPTLAKPRKRRRKASLISAAARAGLRRGR